MTRLYFSTFRIVGCVVLGSIFLLSCDHSNIELNYPIMGNLDMGKHVVGYKTIFVYDKTRRGVPFSDWDGKIYSDHDPEKGRQFQINLWYPSVKGTGTPLKFRHYVHLMGRQTNFELEGHEEFSERMFISQTNEIGGGGHFTEEHMDTLLNLDVYAQLDAEIKPGPFPVVIFPNGASPAKQSIMAEFLASHGLLVVGFSPKGRFSSGMEISTIGIETAVDDLEFVLYKISEFFFADMNRIALMANAISSSICVAAAARNDNIKALISLEGGLPSLFEQQLLQKSVFYQPENIKLPMLIIYAPHPNIDPRFTFHLIHADRYYAHFPGMSEFAMLNYGMFDSFVADIIGEHNGSTQKGFELAGDLVLKFLNKHLKREIVEIFDDEFLNAAKGVIDTTFVHTAIPASPNIAMMKGYFVKSGFGAIDSIYHSLKSRGNSLPFSKSFYKEYSDWLAWKKDPEYEWRKELYKLACDSYPESALINYKLAYYAGQAKDYVLAFEQYRKAIILADEDPTLSPEERSVILENSREALAEWVGELS